MGNDGALKSVENVTKASMCLPKYLRQTFYCDFKIIHYNKREMNLKIFENWLGEPIYDVNQSRLKRNNKSTKITRKQ